MTRTYTAALPTAYVVLRIFIVLNWLFAVFGVAVLAATLIDPDWSLRAIGLSTGGGVASIMVLRGLQAIAAIGLICIPLNDAVLRRLLAIVLTVRRGDPFIVANAYRLNTIAWILLALQLMSIVIGTVAKAISTPERPLHLDAGFSASGWLAVLLTFVLARIFAEGAVMRRDLEGTV